MVQEVRQAHRRDQGRGDLALEILGLAPQVPTAQGVGDLPHGRAPEDRLLGDDEDGLHVGQARRQVGADRLDVVGRHPVDHRHAQRAALSQERLPSEAHGRDDLRRVLTGPVHDGHQRGTEVVGDLGVEIELE